MRTLESFEITLTLSKRRSTTYFSQHYLVERSPSLRQLLTLIPAKRGLGVPDLRFEDAQSLHSSLLILRQ